MCLESTGALYEIDVVLGDGNLTDFSRPHVLVFTKNVTNLCVILLIHVVKVDIRGGNRFIVFLHMDITIVGQVFVNHGGVPRADVSLPVKLIGDIRYAE